MFSKMTQALILSGCLLAAGAASADERNVLVPVIAGAAVGAVLATVLSDSGHDHHHRQQYQRYQGYQPPPRYQPQYQPRYQPVAYERVEYRQVPPPRGYYGGGYDRGYGPQGGRW